MKALPPEQLDALRRITSPTLSNAIERFNVRPRNQGFMNPEIRCLFPDLGAMVGYAVTATCRAEMPAALGRTPSRFDYWDYIVSMPAPRIMVIQDLDQPPGMGAYWGEVQASIHKALGCAGTITNGGVRDLDEVRGQGYHFFAGAVCVSHAHVHLVDFGQPVKVGGIIVRPGDLLHADQHGVLVIPQEIAADLPAAVAEVEREERQIIDYCRSKSFTLEGLKEVFTRARGKG